MNLFSKLLTTAFSSLAACVLLFTFYSAALDAHARPDHPNRAFQQALAEYKAGHRTIAYGQFMRLADQGDAESARIALMLLRHGEEMHGTAWGASQPQIDRWIRLASQPMPRIVAESGD